MSQINRTTRVHLIASRSNNRRCYLAKIGTSGTGVVISF